MIVLFCYESSVLTTTRTAGAATVCKEMYKTHLPPTINLFLARPKIKAHL